MTKPAKLYADLLRSHSRVIAFADFQRLLAAFGWVLARTGGSHRVYRHDQCPHPLNVQPRGTGAKDYQVRLFMEYVEVYQLRIEP